MSSSKQYNIPAYPLIPAQAVSADVTSAVTNIFNVDDIGYQAHWTGTLVGTFYVQLSLDYDPRFPNNATWTSMTLDPVPAAAGSAGDAYIDITQISSKWIRLFFDYTSGSGNLTVYFVAKGV